VTTTTTTTTNPSHPRKTAAMRAQEDAAAAPPSRITKYVFIYSQFVYFYYFTSFLYRNAAILEESGITVAPPERPKTTTPTPATSTSIPKPTRLRRADVVTTNPESMQIKTGKRNKADDGTSSETSTSTTGENGDDDRDEDNNSNEDEDDRDEDEDERDEDEDERDEDEDERDEDKDELDEDKDERDEAVRDDNDSEPKDRRELSGDSVGIAKGTGGGTYSNAATPIAPAANERDSASGIDNNNSGPWGGNNTTGTAGGPATPLATATTTPTAAAFTPTRTTSTPTTTVGGTATTGDDLDMASRHDLQGASCTVGGVLRGRARGNVYNMADNFETEDPFIKPVIGIFFLVSDCEIFIYPFSGKVHVFRLHGNPDAMEPYTMIKVKVTDTLGPVLEKLGEQFSPVRSE
jgi:hypothetical protein